MVSRARFSSLKLLEYMASGRPIVATDVDESWPVRESGAGIITPIDPKIFAENIITLLEDKKLAKELAKKGIEYARRFSWDDMIKKYVELFIKITEE
ncbi:MAG: glycosyltransferase family 4 protein [Nitrososphaerota archaeon]